MLERWVKPGTGSPDPQPWGREVKTYAAPCPRCGWATPFTIETMLGTTELSDPANVMRQATVLGGEAIVLLNEVLVMGIASRYTPGPCCFCKFPISGKVDPCRACTLEQRIYELIGKAEALHFP